MPDASFEQIVERWYDPLYRFAMSLTRGDSLAADLTQDTFCIWAERGHQLRDASKVKSWLFTTLYREFTRSYRQAARHPHFGIEEHEHELPPIQPAQVDAMDGHTVLDALCRVDECYRSALTLFYIEEHSYREIAELLEIPIGTVMSRLARGKEQLRRLLVDALAGGERTVIPLEQTRGTKSLTP